MYVCMYVNFASFSYACQVLFQKINITFLLHKTPECNFHYFIINLSKSQDRTWFFVVVNNKIDAAFLWVASILISGLVDGITTFIWYFPEPGEWYTIRKKCFGVQRHIQALFLTDSFFACLRKKFLASSSVLNLMFCPNI